MSDFDGAEIERYLAEIREEDERLAVVDSFIDQQNAAIRQDLLLALGNYGIVASVRHPGDALNDQDDLFNIEVIATSDSLDGISESASFEWSNFADRLISAKAFQINGDGSHDASAIKCTKAALTTILINSEIPPVDKQAAIRAAEAFLGKESVAQPLLQWGFKPEQQIIDDPQFARKTSLIRTSEEKRIEQIYHNRQVKKDIRPMARELLSEQLSVEHDDFNVLLSTVEVAAMFMLEPDAIENVTSTEDILQLLANKFSTFKYSLLKRLNLDPYELAKIAHILAPLYYDAGYRSTEEW